MNEIGFNWRVDARGRFDDPTWIKKYNQLCQLKAVQGHIDTIGRCNLQLSKWASVQRAEYQAKIEGAKSHLSDHRMELLNAIGFDFRLRSITETKRNTKYIIKDNNGLIHYSLT